MSRAVVVIGLTTEETQAARLRSQAELIKKGLIARGLAGDDIDLLGFDAGAPVRREKILEALKPGAKTPDETWVVLLGTVAPSRDGQAAFQVPGPRLTATDLVDALAVVPGKTFVMVGAAGGGGLIEPLLKLPGVEAVAATAASGEVNEPRFPQCWADALNDKPQAAFASIAAEAAQRVAEFYKENKIVLSEHACLIDRGRSCIIQAPFDAGLVASNETKNVQPQSKAKTVVNVADIEIPKPSGDLDTERKEATPETRQLIADGLAMAKGSSYAALIMNEQIALTVGRNFSTLETWQKRIYVNTAEAIDEVATLNMPSEPPYLTMSLQAARVILTNGEQILVNPRSATARASAARDESKTPGRPVPSGPPIIQLPEVVVGCVVEVVWTVERRSAAQIPEFYEEWHLAAKYPVAALRVQLTMPSDEHWRFLAHALPAEVKPVENGSVKSISWELHDLPALELLAGDPPVRASTPWLGVSSLPSWEAFADWYRRLSRGAEETGPTVKELAAQIGREHPDRAGRVRAAFERVAALRYVAIELGVGAFRPRTPEQVWQQRYGDCKDKANLLVGVLRQLGIEAEFVLVNRGDVTFADFPGWQFNHAIAHVPASPEDGQPADLWLDATDRLVPFGVIAPGDLGRQVLVFPKSGPARFMEIVSTQEPASEWRESWKLLPDTSGINYTGSITLTATGAADAMLRRTFTDLSPLQRAVRLHDLLNITTLAIESVTVGDAYDLGQNYRVEAKVRVALPKAIPACPPGLGRVLVLPNRSLPLQIGEGRASRYVQEIAWGAEPGDYADVRRSEAAGFVFSRARRQGGQLTEVSIPAGSLSPEAYPQVYKAWLEFNAPPISSTQSP